MKRYSKAALMVGIVFISIGDQHASADDNKSLPDISLQWAPPPQQPRQLPATVIPNIIYTNISGVGCTNAYTILRLGAADKNGKLEAYDVEGRDVEFSPTSGVIDAVMMNFVIRTFPWQFSRELYGTGLVTYAVYMPTNSMSASTNNTKKVSNTLMLPYTLDQRE